MSEEPPPGPYPPAGAGSGQQPQQYPGYPPLPQYPGYPQQYPGYPQQYPGYPPQYAGYPQQYPGYPGYPGLPYPQPRSSGLGWLKWVGIGCGGLIVLAIAGIVIAAIVIYTHRPLKDFPAYPGAHEGSDNFSSTNGRTSETRIWTVPASLSTTEAWYEGHVTGDWILDSHGEFGVWSFHTSGGSGDILFRSTGANSTEVDVSFTSS